MKQVSKEKTLSQRLSYLQNMLQKYRSIPFSLSLKSMDVASVYNCNTGICYVLQYSNQSECKRLSLWILCSILLEPFLRGWLQILTGFASTHSSGCLAMELSNLWQHIAILQKKEFSRISAFPSIVAEGWEILGFYS